MLRGFFMYQHSQKREEVVLRDRLDFTIQVQEKKNGVVKSSSGNWCHGSSIDWTTVEIDVHDIDLDSELEVKISRQSMGWPNRIWDGNREFTLKRQHFNRNVLPSEWETCTSLGYWCNLDEYPGPQKSITCGYCLSCNEEQSEMVYVNGLGEKIKLGNCCKIVENELSPKQEQSIASMASKISNTTYDVKAFKRIQAEREEALAKSQARDSIPAPVINKKN
jgi:hypothetical protein